MKLGMVLLLLLSLITSSAAYTYTNVLLKRPLVAKSFNICTTTRLNTCISDDDVEDESSFARSLSERIAQVQNEESSFVAGLQKRVQSITRADEFDSTSGMVFLPVICLDALLPNQRLSGATTDPAFINILRYLGLGGSLVMTSINNRQRKIRRFGTICRIEFVDVENDGNNYDNDDMLSIPTSVTFTIAGKRRCEILGNRIDMTTCIGRWRRGYDPDGEESRLGWGDERFVDKPDNDNEKEYNSGIPLVVANKNSTTCWNNNNILIIEEATEDAHATTDSIAKATYLIPLIERWISLASDQTTYDNIDVVARTRTRAGFPGLSVNASALIRKVQQEIGPQPSPSCPTSFAVWGAALINPLPALGVATELRGAVLEAPGAERKLAVLERGLIKSINNLDGTRPLNM